MLFYFALLKEIPNSKADSVSVTLYYEALCGGCHDWITTELVSTYEKLGQYIDFEFVPYGNAHVRFFKISFHCQLVQYFQ